MTQLEILPPISGGSPQKCALNELPFPISGLISSRFQVAGGGPLPAIILIMRLPAARSKVMLLDLDSPLPPNQRVQIGGSTRFQVEFTAKASARTHAAAEPRAAKR